VQAATRARPGARRERVTFTSGGERIVGTLFRPEGVSGPLPGVVVAGSWTTVKEQMAELYARELAARGFAALAFDFRNWGESGGQVRDYESPAMKIADIKEAAAFLARQPGVRPGGVGGLGVCASAGYMAHAVADGSDIRSFGTVANWLHDTNSARTLYGERYDRFLGQGRQAKAKFDRSGEVDYVPAFSQTDPNAAMQMDQPGYYGDPARGAVRQWPNRFAVMSWPEWLTFDALAPAERIRVPTLMIHSDQSALPDNARKFHAALKGPKALYWMQGMHLDFYDRAPLVAESMDVMATHFQRTLV
jgi:dienelactone hydrolase